MGVDSKSFKFSRGVPANAEAAFAFFGLSVCTRTRQAVFAKLSKKNQDNQTLLFSAQSSLTLGYDNVQRGLGIQHQRGQSSAFFKGTHEVAHEIFPFTNRRYDSSFAEMTYHNQPIPSPYGMQALEEVDMSNIVPFLIGNCDLPIGVPPAPDVSGEK